VQQQPLLLLPPCPVHPRSLEFAIADQTTADGSAFNPMTLLRDFDYGTIKRENGRTVREFEATASGKHYSSTVLSRFRVGI